MDKQTILEVKNITKTFPGVVALKNINLSFKSGEVNALVGENGAGKSTLMNIIDGVFPPDEGSQIIYKGEPVTFKSTNDANSHGIAMIHQENSLVQHLTVYENIFLGHFPKKGIFVDKEKMIITAQDLLTQLKISHISPSAYIRDLSSSEQQLIEIAKALTANPEVIIMDEPTAALTIKETEILMDIINNLKTKGVSIVFISHRLEEIFQICDVVSVLRDGQHIGTYDINDITLSKVISLMVGRELSSNIPKKTQEEIARRTRTKDAPTVLEVEGICRPGKVKNVSFVLHEGEILGFAGLVGAGRTELMECIYGYVKPSAGKIKIGGKPVKIKNSKHAVEMGLGMVSEDRKVNGILPLHSVKDNINSASWRHLKKGLFLSKVKEDTNAIEYIKRINVRTPSLATGISTLSGGNQQKTLLSRMLSTKPRILILDEPTHGIDVGAKEEIYSIINKLSESGISIILVSSELPELISLSHRMVIMYEGGIKGILEFSDYDQEKIITIASGNL
ncbi:MAG: sugar ABC transporter ATP-binding protein [Burkholderiales bacterium]